MSKMRLVITVDVDLEESGLDPDEVKDNMPDIAKENEMNREKLFKAKRKDNGEWVEGCLLIDYITGQYFIHRYGDSVNESDKVGEEGCLRFLAFEVDPETICQYTGLTDIKKVKAFENDIVFCENIGSTGKIVFIDGQYKIEWEKNDALRTDIKWWFSERRVYVIGNIFDNPELLEQEGQNE